MRMHETIDIIDYVTGIGNGAHAPYHTNTDLLYYQCCACCAFEREQQSQTASS